MKTSLTDTFLQYSKNYNCSITQAIHDRDWPMNREQCIKEFEAATGKKPTDSEINEMSPDNQKTINEEKARQDWEDFDMGRR